MNRIIGGIMIEKLVKGNIIDVGEIKAVVVSDLMKFKDTYAIYCDIISQSGNKTCCVKKIDDKVALVLRNKEKLLKMNLNSEERRAIYCHELGHCFSEKQKNRKNDSKHERTIEDEIDSDSFAIKKCGISPIILESALKKTYEYEIGNIKNRGDLTQEKINKFIMEMTARKRNVEKLISEMKKER